MLEYYIHIVGQCHVTTIAIIMNIIVHTREPIVQPGYCKTIVSVPVYSWFQLGWHLAINFLASGVVLLEVNLNRMVSQLRGTSLSELCCIQLDYSHLKESSV